MKQSVSVFMVMLQSIWKKILLILIILVAAESILFLMASRKFLWVEDILDSSRISWVFYGALLLLLTVLCLVRSGSSHPVYTLQRLALTGQQILRIQMLSNLFCLLLLWAVQLATALLLVKIYLAGQSSSAEHQLDFCGQSLFLAFCRSEFLHGLFPMEDLTRWMRNVVLICCMAAVCAYASFTYEKGKFPVSPFLLAVPAIVFFEMEMGRILADSLLSAFALTVVLILHRSLPSGNPFAESDTTGYYNPADTAIIPEELEVMK